MWTSHRIARSPRALLRAVSPVTIAVLTASAWSLAPAVRALAADAAKVAPPLDAWVMSREHGHWNDGSGDTSDWDDARDAAAKIAGDSFWFRIGDRQYLVTDRAQLDRAAEIFKPQEEMGRRQGDLGRKQGELGRLQGELGRKQGRLGVLQADISRRQARMAVADAGELSGLEREAYERQRDDLRRSAQEIEGLQSDIGVLQGDLGERQSALGEQQAAIGREQERIGREVRAQLGEFVRDAIAKGLAKPL